MKEVRGSDAAVKGGQAFQADRVNKVERRGGAVRGKPIQGCLIGLAQITERTLSEMRSH